MNRWNQLTWRKPWRKLIDFVFLFSWWFLFGMQRKSVVLLCCKNLSVVFLVWHFKHGVALWTMLDDDKSIVHQLVDNIYLKTRNLQTPNNTMTWFSQRCLSLNLSQGHEGIWQCVSKKCMSGLIMIWCFNESTFPSHTQIHGRMIRIQHQKIEINKIYNSYGSKN